MGPCRRGLVPRRALHQPVLHNAEHGLADHLRVAPPWRAPTEESEFVPLFIRARQVQPRGVQRATPQVAYSFVTKRCPALHTFTRAGRSAGTRRATKSPLSRCSYLSENASIREERFRNPAYPFVAWGS